MGEEAKQQTSRLVRLGNAEIGDGESVASGDGNGSTLEGVLKSAECCTTLNVLLSIGFLALGICLGLVAGLEMAHRQRLVRDDGGQTHPLQHPDFLPTANADDFLDQVDVAAQETKSTVVESSPGNTTLLPLPPLSDLLKRNKIKRGADISWMLDFSIADFPKAGTTFLMNYLRKSEEIYMNRGEVCYLDRRFPSQLVTKYYEPHLQRRQTEDGHRIQFGIKCPEELETEFGLDRYTKYFPDIKFIVSIRHPISWFESYYNFRVYKRYPLEMPKTTDLIGPCEENYAYVQWNCSTNCPSGNQNVCTNRGNFHWAFSRLGKTPMSTPEEKELLQHEMEIVPMKSKIFLVENRQLLAENPASQNFTSDLRDFLGLHHDLDPLSPYVPDSPDEKYPNKSAYEKRINICDEEHDEVRSVLLKIGRDAAKWIRDYFIESRDVVVTSRDLFVKLLEDWDRDPCDDRYRTLLEDTPE